jgi:tRNA/tmRNA/rRNA uracil-C5-methylase (TrmA/RlmC/RlmD family)
MVPVTDSASTGPLPGDILELAVGEAANGGWCVARHDDRGSRVVFVRHALPGERVRAVVTQATAKFARADAIEILEPSPDRVPPPCPHAHPGGCGGCDWQHASLPAQRRLKAVVIRQQLTRIAGIEREVTVEPLDGDDGAENGAPEDGGWREGTGHGGAGGRGAGLGWRTRVSFAIAPDGAAGLRRHRSHEVIEVGECPIAYPTIVDVGVTDRRWPGATSVQVAVVPATGERGVLITESAGPDSHSGRGSDRGRGGDRGRGNRGGRDGDRRRGGDRGQRQRPVPVVETVLAESGLVGTVLADTVQAVRRSGGRTGLSGRPYLTQRAAGRDWRVDLGGFWQVHPAAADTLTEAVLDALAPRPGEIALDLYCGAGLFAGSLAAAVGPAGRVIGVESDDAAVRDARHNLREWPWARVHKGDVGEVLQRIGLQEASIVVLDPPRTGAERLVTDVLRATDSATLRRIAYVSCDPATLARDLARLADGGWMLTGLRAFDAFPMTHHVECLATLEPSGELL